MSSTAANIITTKSKVSYTPINNYQDGVSYIHRNTYAVNSIHYTATVTGLTRRDLLKGISCSIVFYHIYGTITRSDITDETAYYQVMNTLPSPDDVILIPAKSVATFDYVDIVTSTRANKHYRLYVQPMNKNHKPVSTKYTIDVQIDEHSL